MAGRERPRLAVDGLDHHDAEDEESKNHTEPKIFPHNFPRIDIPLPGLERPHGVAQMTPGAIRVVAGIAIRGNRMLAAKRPAGGAFPGRWEFPGGKIENGEQPISALVRELREELGVESEVGALVSQGLHDYGDCAVDLQFYAVRVQGEPAALDGGTIEWITPESARDLAFLEGDKDLLTTLARDGALQRLEESLPPPLPSPLRLALFDFDGTIADSLTDIAASSNFALDKLGLPPRSMSEIRAFVGHGVRHLLSQALGAEHADRLNEAHAIYSAHYDEHLADHTALLPGALPLLEALTERGVPIGVVSNKPRPFTEKICKALGLGQCERIYGPETESEKKPSPLLIERALADFGCSAAESIFVGDTSVDVIAGRAAGLYTIAVLGGFRDESEVRAAVPDRVVGRLDETIAFLP